MVQLEIRYLGELRCEARHGPSGAMLMTDAPVDNMGRGESFSPTDLVATALGTCMMTLMGIVAQRHNLDLAGSTVTVVKEMAKVPIRRIGSLRCDIHVPVDLSAEDQERLRTAALTCPVHKSLHPDIALPITFTFGTR